MFDRLKRVLVKTFIGTIALGYLLAQAILYFISIFPYLATGLLMPRSTVSANPQFQAALRETISFIVLLLIWYGLLRWLYFTPPKEETSGLAGNPERAA
jgi:hypothetical protein